MSEVDSSMLEVEKPRIEDANGLFMRANIVKKIIFALSSPSTVLTDPLWEEKKYHVSPGYEHQYLPGQMANRLHKAKAQELIHVIHHLIHYCGVS